MTNPNLEYRDQRDVGLDLVRSAAALMVVVLHVAAVLFNIRGDSWIAVNTYESMVRASVPLFFMSSGAIFIGKPPALPTKQLAKVAMLLAVWSYFYIFVDIARTGWDLEKLSPLRVTKGPVVYHFWFFYSILGLYLFFPLLQSFRVASTKLHLFFIAAWFLAITLATLKSIGVSIPLRIDLVYFAPYAGYAFLGWLLIHRKFGLPLLLIAAVTYGAACSLIGLGTYELSAGAAKPSQLLYRYETPLVAITACCAFIILLHVGRSVTSYHVGRAISFVGKNTLGIYVFHVFVLSVLYGWGLKPNVVNPWAGIPLVATAAFLISLGISAAVRTIPGLRKTLP